jgi:DNA-directed RNA polymerase I, II, and III subunit RPABC1
MSILQSHQIEKNEEDIRKTVLTNVIKMITARGILVEGDLEKNITDILSQQSDDSIYKLKKIENQIPIIIKLYPTKISSINKTSNIYEFLAKQNEFHKIIVAKDINENNIKNIKSNFPRTEIFLEHNMMINLLDNELVPKFVIMPQDSELYKNFWNDYTVKKKQMPRMLANDPVALYYNLKKGDLVKIIRPSESTGQSAAYRLVV